MSKVPTRRESGAVATAITTQSAEDDDLHPGWCSTHPSRCQVDETLTGEHVGCRNLIKFDDGGVLDLALVQFVEPGEVPSPAQLRMEVVGCGVEVGADPIYLRLSQDELTELTVKLIQMMAEYREELEEAIR
jgi:hypothetical protein